MAQRKKSKSGLQPVPEQAEERAVNSTIAECSERIYIFYSYGTSLTRLHLSLDSQMNT